MATNSFGQESLRLSELDVLLKAGSGRARGDFLKILISVQNQDEAKAVLQAGSEVKRPVDFLDLKDPAKGALGSVSQPVFSQILTVMNKLEIDQSLDFRPHLTAACGEWNDPVSESLPSGVSMAKLGTAGFRNHPDQWKSVWGNWSRSLPEGCQPVLVSYADWNSCNGMEPEQAIDLAAENKSKFGHVRHVLIDTFDKNLPGLEDLAGGWGVVSSWIERAKDQGLSLVLAGKLTQGDLKILEEIGAEIAGVRSAVCQSKRDGEIDPEKVKGILERFR